MADNYTKQIMSIFNGELDIRMLSDDVVDLFLELYPYSPYGHLINYLKARATNQPDANQLLNKLATYSPDRAWLQEVLKTSFSKLDLQDGHSESIPSEAINPNLDKYLFEFDFLEAQKQIKSDLEIVPETDHETGTTSESTLELEPKPELISALETEDVESSESEIEEVRLSPSTPVEDVPLSYAQWLQSFKVKIDDKLNIEDPPITEKKEDPIALEPISTTRKEDDIFGGIITETLAALLADQGQIDRAIIMYKRLSLIFPEKSSFFAAKIAELKKK